MGKWVRGIVMLILLAVFLFSAVSIAMILYRYRVSDKRYEDASRRFIAENGTDTGKAGDTEGTAGTGEPEGQEGEGQRGELAPIVVDFEGLQKVNGDVAGWIYGEDTLINYPVMQGADNDFYLHHSYDGQESQSGAIFAAAENRPGFADANTILYGHHMKNKSMFGSLEYWSSQEYYEEHPILWLLTPQQDYKIILFSGYTTSADSETYMVFSQKDSQMEEYIASCLAKSDFQAADPGEGERYVLLSTCAYNFSDARYVLHGLLKPVDSAGGRRLE